LAHGKNVQLLKTGKKLFSLTLFHAALGLLAQAHCVLTPHKEDQF
jgi:hypothetical protein